MAIDRDERHEFAEGDLTWSESLGEALRTILNTQTVVIIQNCSIFNAKTLL